MSKKYTLEDLVLAYKKVLTSEKAKKHQHEEVAEKIASNISTEQLLKEINNE